MRAGLNTIQQTLTPEAATVLNHSIAEAGRRNHGQTTPLHVASTLLSSPSGYLRQACIKSHPNSSHPLQCRALELCFSVALERLPTAQNLNPGPDPPISNALMAALKRAQAHQRRGCPEQQQQPLLAVKVELEQLIISILDDPSVSRVMREASFSSPAVKATIEQSLNSPQPPPPSSSGPIGMGNRNMYVNPRLAGLGSDEVKRVVEILVRGGKKRNPVLVGESEPEMVVKEALRKIIESKEVIGDVEVIHLEKEFAGAGDRQRIVSKIAELGGLVETRLAAAGNSGSGLVLDLGDLKWLVDQGVQQQIGSEFGKMAVAEMGKLVGKFREGRRIWLIGTATCETYLRCQVYHPTMENDWDLQAVPIANRAPLPGMFPRLGTTGFLGNSFESLSSSPLKSFPTVPITPLKQLPNNQDPARKTKLCDQCNQNYEQELAKHVPKNIEKPSTDDVSSEATHQQSLPPWLKNATTNDLAATTKDQELIQKQKTMALQRKWHDTCLRLHPGHHRSERITQPLAISMPSLYNQKTLVPCVPRIGLTGNNLSGALQLNTNLLAKQNPRKVISPPGSPVRTELVLGRPKLADEAKGNETVTKDLLSTAAAAPDSHEFQISKLLDKLDADSYKKLLKGLMEKVWWQQEAASAVATVMTQCKIGNGKRRGNASKGDIWLLFTGPDRIGKKKMAVAVSELVRQSNPVTVHLGSRRSDGDSEVNFRGKTVMDRIVEAVRRNPFSVVVLEDIDEADMLVKGSIKRAMERGRLADSHGREISLGNVIFILTSSWLPNNSLDFVSSHEYALDEKKLASFVSGGWQLRLTVHGKTAKRRASWLDEEDRPTKPRKDTGLTFDLNEEAAEIEQVGSRNSSDVTVDHEDEHFLSTRLLTPPTSSSLPSELLDLLDDSIVFKPVDFGAIRRDISNSITDRASSIIGDGNNLELQADALEKIAGGLCLGYTGLEEWTEKVLVPSLRQVRMRLTGDQSMVVRLEPDSETDSRGPGDWLPSSIRVMVDGRF
ncbi:Protein SUPPRESSOR OF MAX2 1 [Linum grandiflorum]